MSNTPKSPSSPLSRSGAPAKPLEIPDSLRISSDELKIGSKVLGTGGFAQVVDGELLPNPNRVGRGETKQVAIKVMQKAQVTKTSFSNLQTEINICAELRHECIINTWGIMEDDTSIYIVMDMAKGGELFKYIKKYGLEDMPLVGPRFLGGVVLGLEYMLSKGVLHRDIKPENLLLTEDYHVKIADFGTVCRVEDAKASGFTGTPSYVSPEVLTNGCASPVSDLWALGCVVYQLYVGRSPFEGNSQYLVLQAVKERKIEYPHERYFPAVVKDLVEKLLTVDPEKRLGAGGIEEVKSHPYFKDVDWNGLLSSTNVTHLNANHSKVWERFLFDKEEVVYCSKIVKTRRFSTKTRILILTDFPRLFYVDPETDLQKGQVPWSNSLCAAAHDDSNFTVHTPDRDYIFTDSEKRAALWVMKINDLVKSKKTR